MRTLWLWIPLIVTLALLSACGEPTRTVSTRIDGSSVSVSDRFKDQGQGEKHTSRVEVTPATAPTVTVNAPPTYVKVDGREVSAPPGASVVVEFSDDKPPASTEHTREANAVGATIRTDGDPGKMGVSAEAPHIELDPTNNVGTAGGTSRGGGSNADGAAMSFDFAPIVQGLKSPAAVGLFFILAAVCAICTIGYAVGERMIHSPIDWGIVAIGVVATLGMIGLALTIRDHPWMLILFFVAMVIAVGGYCLWWKFGKKNVVEEVGKITIGGMV